MFGANPAPAAPQLRSKLDAFARRAAASWLPWFLLGTSAGGILFWEG